MQHVIITGASRRLGLYLTKRFLQNGWFVHALTRQASPELLVLKCEQLSIHKLNDYSEASVDYFIAHFQQNFSSLDLLINNASIYENDELFMSQGIKFYESLVFIHMGMPALLARGLIGELIEANGNIVSITDIYANNPNEAYSLYCSTKAGLQNLTLSFAKKFAPNVRANCIQPGPIKFLNEHDSEYQQSVLSETLLPFEGGFEPMFKTIQFILDNNYLTGNCIKVDGGRSLVRA